MATERDKLHEDLLKRWANEPHHRAKPHFIKDGIIDPGKWADAKRKVLFLLKEAYTEDPNCDDDLCTLIRDRWEPSDKWGKGQRNTWWHVFRWAFGALHGGPLINKRKEVEDCRFSIAVVNVKKSGGTPRSNSKEIEDYADRDRKYLVEQIDLIDPHIVICGGTWDAVQGLWSWECVAGCNRAYRVGRRLFISFYHPAARLAWEKPYDELCDILRCACFEPPQAG